MLSLQLIMFEVVGGANIAGRMFLIYHLHAVLCLRVFASFKPIGVLVHMVPCTKQ